jgi:hypothetical protein
LASILKKSKSLWKKEEFKQREILKKRNLKKGV